MLLFHGLTTNMTVVCCWPTPLASTVSYCISIDLFLCYYWSLTNSLQDRHCCCNDGRISLGCWYHLHVKRFGPSKYGLPSNRQHIHVHPSLYSTHTHTHTHTGGSMLAQSLKQNNNMQISLVHLNLSGNPFGSDPLASLTFIQEPQTISHLDLSGCGLNLDSVVQVLIRGCQQHLVTLDLSHNSGKGKKGVLSVNVATKLQQFFSSCIAITSINLTDCRLTSEIVL